jgi:hypothetical protein
MNTKCFETAMRCTAVCNLWFFLFFLLKLKANNLRRGELGDRLGAFGDGVLGEFTREDQSHRRLDLTGRDRRLLVVSRELGGFGRNLFEDVVDERVHDGHRLGRDARVRVHLLQHLVDVNLVRFRLRLAAALLGASGLLGCGLLTGHVDCWYFSCKVVTRRRARVAEVRRNADDGANARTGSRVWVERLVMIGGLYIRRM